MFTFIFAIFLSAAVHAAPAYKCAALSGDKAQSLTSTDDGYEVVSQDPKHLYKISFKFSQAELTHRELLKNDGDFVQHQLLCQLDKNTCSGKLITSYRGRKNSRVFKNQPVRSSTFVMDGDRAIFEFQLFQNEMKLVFKEHELSLRCRK